MRCHYIKEDGKCSGQYKGFKCIEEKCKAEREPVCEFYPNGFYCTKLGRFGCIGRSKCDGTIQSYIQAANPKAKA